MSKVTPSNQVKLVTYLKKDAELNTNNESSDSEGDVEKHIRNINNFTQRLDENAGKSKNSSRQTAVVITDYKKLSSMYAKKQRGEEGMKKDLVWAHEGESEKAGFFHDFFFQGIPPTYTTRNKVNLKLKGTTAGNYWDAFQTLLSLIACSFYVASTYDGEVSKNYIFLAIHYF